jgi:hypothetical protein
MANPVVANIIYGNALVYYGPVGETVPADTVGADVAWGGNWKRVGYTQEPVTMAYEDEQTDVGVQEELTPVNRFKSAESVIIETVLSELIPDYMELAVGAGAVADTAQDTDQPPKETFNVGGEAVLDKYAWGIEGTYRDGSGNEFPARFFIWKATAKLNGELEFAKDRENGTGVPLQINALTDTSKAAGQKLFRMVRITGAAL